MTSSKLFKGLACVAMMGVTACSTMGQPSITSQNAATVQQAQSFAFLSDKPLVRSIPEYPDFPAVIADKEIRDSIKTRMEARGYRLNADANDADLVIGYAVSAREVIDQYFEAYRGRYGHIRTVRALDNDYIEGTIVIDLFDKNGGSVIWTGDYRRDLYSPPRSKRAEVIDKAVGKILNELWEDIGKQ